MRKFQQEVSCESYSDKNPTIKWSRDEKVNTKSLLFSSCKVRTMLEEDTQMDLKEYRSFIDEEMFTILGQMDSASKIFDHVYLVSSYKLV